MIIQLPAILLFVFLAYSMFFGAHLPDFEKILAMIRVGADENVADKADQVNVDKIGVADGDANNAKPDVKTSTNGAPATESTNNNVSKDPDTTLKSSSNPPNPTNTPSPIPTNVLSAKPAAVNKSAKLDPPDMTKVSTVTLPPSRLTNANLSLSEAFDIGNWAMGRWNLEGMAKRGDIEEIKNFRDFFNYGEIKFDQTANYACYSVYLHAVKKREFAFAREVLALITKDMDEGFIKYAKGGEKKLKKSILMMTVWAYFEGPKDDVNVADYELLKAEIVGKFYGGKYPKYYKALVDEDQVAIKALGFADPSIQQLLQAAAEEDDVDSIALYVLRKKINAPDQKEFINDIQTFIIYPHLRSVGIIKLLKSLGIPIISPISGNPRENVYSMADQKLRKQILDLLRLPEGALNEYNKKTLEKFLNGDIKMTMREAILSRKKSYVLALFNRSDLGVYQKSWILLATKMSSNEILGTLLEERCPLPTAPELSGASQSVLNLIDKYRKYYDSATLLCNEGPIGCKGQPVEPPAAKTVSKSDIEKLRLQLVESELNALK